MAAVADVNVGLDPDPYPLLASAQVQAGGSNVSGFQDPTLDAALTAARAPGTDTARRAAYARLQTVLGKLEPILPLFFRDSDFVVSNRLTGPHRGPGFGPEWPLLGRDSMVVLRAVTLAVRSAACRGGGIGRRASFRS